MKTPFHHLKLMHVDKSLTLWRAANLPMRPSSGWIKAIREALGMSSVYLSKKLGIVPSSLTRLEESEKDYTITLHSLKRAADALGCELHYALVPKRTLTETLEKKADEIARKRMKTVTHTMALEAQRTSEETTEIQKKQLIQELLSGSRRKLWH